MKDPRCQERIRAANHFGLVLVCVFLVTVWARSFPIQPQKSPADKYAQAESYVHRHDFDRAVVVLRQILAESPDDARAYDLLGVALTGGGELAEANQSFRRAIELDPQLHSALKRLAINELRLGRVKEAKTHFEQYLQNDPQDPLVHLSLGEIYFAEKRFAAAAKQYPLSGHLFLQRPVFIINFATSCIRSNHAAQAREALQHIPPDASPSMHFQAGLLLAEVHDYTASAREFEAAQKGYPDPYLVGFNLTLAYLKGQDYSAAIRVARELISKGYRRASLYSLLSQAYEHDGETKRAYNALRQAILLDPQNEDSYLDMVDLCLAHVNYDLALEIANMGLQNLPRSYRLRLERGTVYADKEEFPKAIKDFETASQIRPGKGMPYFAKAMALVQMDQLHAATETLRRGAAVSPGDYLVWYGLGFVLTRFAAVPGGALEKQAIRALERSIRLKPTFADSHAVLGKVLLNSGKTDRAIVEFEVALKLDPADQSPTYELAIAFRRKGEKARADELLAKFEKYKAQHRHEMQPKRIFEIIRGGER